MISGSGSAPRSGLGAAEPGLRFLEFYLLGALGIAQWLATPATRHEVAMPAAQRDRSTAGDRDRCSPWQPSP